MAKEIKSRKTTLEERIKIVEHCIANDYAASAKDFRCSYGQVYSWVSKINKVWMALKTDADAINPRMN